MSTPSPMPASTTGSTSMALPADDEEAIARLSAVKGIGRWSAEIYLLFADGRGDVFPAGDLAVQIELGRILGLDAPDRKGDPRPRRRRSGPDRGALAVFLWHHYMTVSAAKGMSEGGRGFAALTWHSWAQFSAATRTSRELR